MVELTHERQRGSYLNLINFVFIIADSLGPIVGGFLAQSGQWRWMYVLLHCFCCNEHTADIPFWRADFCSMLLSDLLVSDMRFLRTLQLIPT